MKYLILLFLMMKLACCTWNSKKDLALNAAKEKIELELMDEGKSSLEKKPLFHKKFVDTLITKAQFDIENISESGDEATIQIKVKLTPPAVRNTLKIIFSKQNENRETNFNGPEALALVYKELKANPNDFSEKTLTVKLTKKLDWKVLSVSP